VWVGHSCPTLLTWVLSLGLTSLSVDVRLNTNINPNVKSVGQECPTHTSNINPNVKSVGQECPTHTGNPSPKVKGVGRAELGR
jgi:hypothetical protein